jgi:RNA polymerase sigma-70 factor, ECF subfamily
MDSRPTHPPSLQYLELVTQSQRTLYGVLWSLLRDANDVDDVMQETNTVLWSKAAEYDPSRAFLPWALKIAQLQVLAFRKRQKRQRRELLDDELVSSLVDDAVQDAASLEPRRRALSSCLQKLATEQRQLVLSRYQPGGSVNAIAENLKRSPKAISESLRRIRALLLDCIERTLAQEAHA